MTITAFNEELIASEMIKELKEAIANQNRIRIQKLYDEAQDLDWDSMPDSLFQEYDELIDKANDILLK